MLISKVPHGQAAPVMVCVKCSNRAVANTMVTTLIEWSTCTGKFSNFVANLYHVVQTTTQQLIHMCMSLTFDKAIATEPLVTTNTVSKELSDRVVVSICHFFV